LTLRATSSATITNALILAEAYRGASGIGNDQLSQPLTVSGTTGTDITLTYSVEYNNSWVVFLATSVQATGLTAGSATTLEQSVQSNITGSANDLAGFIGSNEAAISIPGGATVHCTQGTGNTYAGIALELVQQFSVTPTGHGAGVATKSVPTGFKTVTVGVASSKSLVNSVVYAAAGHATATQVNVGAPLFEHSGGHGSTSVSFTFPSQLKPVGESVSAVATKVASSLRAGTGHIGAVGTAIVQGASSTVQWPDASNLNWPDGDPVYWSSISAPAAGAVASTFTVRASSVRAGAGHTGASATAVISGLAKSVGENVGAMGSAAVATNLKSVSEGISATATPVASSPRAGSSSITARLTLSTLGAINWPDGDGMRWPDNLDYAYWFTPNPTFTFGAGHVAPSVAVVVASNLTSRSGSIGATAVAVLTSSLDVTWPDGSSVRFADASSLTWPVSLTAVNWPDGNPGLWPDNTEMSWPTSLVPNTSSIFAIQGLGW
jgi:hypothetical protein